MCYDFPLGRSTHHAFTQVSVLRRSSLINKSGCAGNLEGCQKVAGASQRSGDLRSRPDGYSTPTRGDRLLKNWDLLREAWQDCSQRSSATGVSSIRRDKLPNLAHLKASLGTFQIQQVSAHNIPIRNRTHSGVALRVLNGTGTTEIKVGLVIGKNPDQCQGLIRRPDAYS